MTLFILLQILIFISFPILIWMEYGVQSSISASSYRLKGNQKGWFYLWLIVLAFTMWWWVPELGIWAWIMGLGLTITGMTPDHEKDPDTHEDLAHAVGTLVAMAAGIVGLLINGLWIIVAVGVLGALVWLFTPNKIWWLECWYMVVFAFGLTRL